MFTINKNNAMEWLFIHCFHIELEFKMLVFLWREETREPSEIQDKKQQQTQLTHGIKSGIQNWATLEGGKHSHDFAFPAPLSFHWPYIVYQFIWLKNSLSLFRKVQL